MAYFIPTSEEKSLNFAQRMKSVARVRWFALMLAGLLTSPAQSADLSLEETVVFFPSLGRRADTGAWEIKIHGWVFEPERRSASLALLRKSLGIHNSEENPVAKAIFNERIRLFLVDNERDKRVSIRLAGQGFRLGKSSPNGHFEERLRILATDLGSLADKNSPITFQALLPVGDTRTFQGEIHLLEDTGVSVISDIDDTIKVSEVTDRQALLQNTFYEPFRPVVGMPELYAHWAVQVGARFHYVSASPWQLYPPLAEFVRSNSFPAGTFHLKQFRWKDESFFDLFKSPEKYKHSVIEPLLKQFPKRRFVLVGDSGEKDPEIYGEVARRFPRQIDGIFIRDVTNENRDATRYQVAFKQLPVSLWHIFRRPSELANVSPNSHPVHPVLSKLFRNVP
jgi:hypothetical protein